MEDMDDMHNMEDKEHVGHKRFVEDNIAETWAPADSHGVGVELFGGYEQKGVLRIDYGRLVLRY